MRSDLLDVVAALHLSKAIFGTIRRNLLWACLYNVLGIPLAMGLFLPLGVSLPPMGAAAAMAEQQVQRLPVLDRDKRLVGIVSLGDLARGGGGGGAERALAGISRPGGQHKQDGPASG